MNKRTITLMTALLSASAVRAAGHEMQMAGMADTVQSAAPAVAKPANDADLQARIAALEAELADLKQQVQALHAAPAPAPPEAHGAHGGPGLSLGNVTVSGMLEMQSYAAVGGSLKQPVFSNPKGNSDFILTHVHPMLSATLNDKTSAMIMWCLTHVGTTAIYQAYLDYAKSDGLDIKAGRWLLPFGAWNAISNATQFPTVSRPLMYLGHEERNIVLQGGPRPILNDEHSDIGLLLSGQAERGKALLSYAAYVSNGFQDTFGDYPDAWIDFRPNEDNNSSKSLGARLAATVGGLTIGASGTGGRYDPANKLSYRIWGADATWRGPAGLTLRAEYATNPVDRDPSNGGRIRRHGWYAMAEKPFGSRWTGVAMYSTLTERPAANVERVSRLTLGLDYKLADTATLKTEIGRLFIGPFVGNPASAPQGTDFRDVTTLKMSTVVSF